MRLKPIFQRVPVPKRLAKVPLACDSAWYTWSVEARTVLERIGRVVDDLDAPMLIHLRRGRGYDYTYSLSRNLSLDDSIGRDIGKLSRTLVRSSPIYGIWFFTGLLDRDITGIAVHFFFAALRDAIAAQASSAWAALYAPLSNTGENAGDFPLHCDLYVPRMLWNVFEDVPSDKSGAAIFLRTVELFEVLEQLDSVPSPIYSSVMKCLTQPIRSDRFGWFYDKLYGEQNPWATELRKHMARRQTPICLFKGDGYLLHDRRWLHGREAPNRGVSTQRVHRFIFESRASQEFKPNRF